MLLQGDAVIVGANEIVWNSFIEITAGLSLSRIRSPISAFVNHAEIRIIRNCFVSDHRPETSSEHNL